MIFHEDNPVLVTSEPGLMWEVTEETEMGEEEVEVENMAPFLIQLIKVYTVKNNSEENKEREGIAPSSERSSNSTSPLLEFAEKNNMNILEDLYNLPSQPTAT